ncbi:OTU domain-containing protein 4-like isoform X2 [Triplophysa rosa]|uniref:ubiquitinyl hydrolase 1 n=1 Tax=Triplophysa rosa TaxID=992332 RepID=A0A9W7WED4_TRIRA|nr:OTU domain-containing protein 4-like isoform X2 [Triplophysa rosa]KAI7794718.1 putative OTU domain-containing protein 4 [Triplophysa rosa]
MEVRRASADAQPQQTGDRTLECRMDEYLRSLGFYRKKIAKDGSCLFRAVAEQILQCQGLHTDVRMACVKYLKQNRSTYEQFIEGDFEKYLENLQDPKSWVGQVEITALSKLYKRDFIVFQQPDEPPVSITENGFPDKVRLCFLNGNHYDSVYPQSFEKSAAVCQSVLYELLYDGVCGVDRSVLGPCVKGGRGQDRLDSEECKSSEESDLEEDEFWSSEVKEKPASEVKTRPSHRGRGRGRARDGGRESLSTKVQKSLNPGVYRNVEYDVWLRSKRLQQQRDFRMAAAMQYTVGDKCKVQLSGRFYSAYVREVSPDNGPVTVFIEELGRQQTVPLLNLRLPSEEPQSWQKVSEKSKRHPAPNNGHTASEWENRGGRRAGKPAPYSATGGRVNKQHSWPPQSSADEQTAGRGKFRRSDQRSSPVRVLQQEEEENALLVLLHKDERNFPSLGTSPQTVTAVEVTKRGGDKKRSRKKDHRGSISETDLTEAPQKPAQRRESNTTEEQERKVIEEPVQRSSPTVSLSVPTPSHTETPAALPASEKTPVQTPNISSSPSVSVTTTLSKPPGQPAPVLPPAAEPNSHSSQALSQNTPVSSSAPTQAALVVPPTTVQAPASVSAPDDLVKTAPPVSISAPPFIPSPAVPVSAPPPAPVQTTASVSDTPHQSSTAPPTDGGNAPPTVQPTADIRTVTATAEPAQAPPPVTPNTSEPRPCESLETPALDVACAPDHLSQPQQLLYPPLQWSHLLRDPLYPGFPLNEKGEVETLPPYSLSQKGEDLPQNINVLRFFFNLGIKAYSQSLWPPISYLGPLTQAYQMHRRAPPPSSSAPANPTPMTPWQLENPPPQNLSSTLDLSLESHSHAPAGSVDMGGYRDHPPPIQMQVPARPPVPWSASPGPGACPEAYPVQFSSPPCAPPANQMYPPSSAGFHLPPQPFEAINHVPLSLVRSQDGCQRSMNPQFGSFQTGTCFHRGQPLDFKPVNIPISVSTMEPPPYGSVVQPYAIGPLQGDIAGLNPLANGNFGRPDVFQKSALVAEEPTQLLHVYCPEDGQELVGVDLRIGQNFYSQSYRGGGRRGQDDRGGYRGRSHRGRKEYSGWGRQDEQPYGGRGHYVR